MPAFEVRVAEVQEHYEGRDQYAIILGLFEDDACINHGVITMSGARVRTIAAEVGPSAAEGLTRVLEGIALFGAQTLEGPPVTTIGLDIGMEEPDPVVIRTVAGSDQELPAVDPGSVVHRLTG